MAAQTLLNGLRLTLGLFTCVVLGQALGCARKVQPQPSVEPQAAAVTASSGAVVATAQVPASAEEPPLNPARVGAEAPDFELSDLNGKPVKLSSFRGKVVVLEWFNPNCPFVKASHTKGSLVNTALRQQKSGVVWLAINSAAPGKQGHGLEANRAGVERFQLSHPVLLDESGRVGHAYGAQHTPHMYVIDARGTLVYRGAIDNSPDGEGESAPNGKLVNYVEAAIADLGAARPVAAPETEAYGCSVKY
jgi:peroxiredoxin